MVNFITRLAVISICMIYQLGSPADDNSNPVEGKYIRAEIYYYGWDVLTRTRLTLEMIRKNPKVTILIHDPYEVARLIEWLQLENMEAVKNSDVAIAAEEDPRLVVDLFEKNGRRTTYYASRFSLLSEDSKKKRPIDERFRQKFVFRTTGTD